MPENALAIASSLIPIVQSEKATDRGKYEYLCLRACGFGIREALKLCRPQGYTHRTLRRWRAEDERFNQLEQQVPEIGRELRLKYLEISYIRNLTLILNLDRQILTKAVSGEELTRSEAAYLNRLRSVYVPQALAFFEDAWRKVGLDDWNIIEAIHRKQETKVLRMKGKKRARPMPEVVEGEIVGYEPLRPSD